MLGSVKQQANPRAHPALLDFSSPNGLRLHLSSLSTPQFATSYTLGTVGLIDGSLSYLFSTLPLSSTQSRSLLIPLRDLVPGYRHLNAPTYPQNDKPEADESLKIYADAVSASRGPRLWGNKPTLLHATLHLPSPTTLTALLLRRLSADTQLSMYLSSTQTSYANASPKASLLTQISRDTGKWSLEGLYSTDSALFGVRGLWNFGGDKSATASSDTANAKEVGKRTRAYKKHQEASLLSAGGEFYYSPLSSLLGLSTGLRFTTLPQSPSTFPYTLTLTLTPLTGSLSTSYSVAASQNLALSSRFGFNVYSYESEMVMGAEIWRRTGRNADTSAAEKRKGVVHSHNFVSGKESSSSTHPGIALYDPLSAEDISSISPIPEEATFTDRSDPLLWAKRRLAGLPPLASASTSTSDAPTDSVLKVRVDQSCNLRLVWEGRVKHLLVEAGLTMGGKGKGGALTNSSGEGGAGGLAGYGWKGIGLSVAYSS